MGDSSRDLREMRSTINCPTRWGGASAVAIVVLWILSSQVVAAPAAPAKAPRPAIDSAIDELRKECVAHQRDPKQPLRKSCDYCTAKPNPAVTIESVFLALEQRIDADAFLTSYIRWQLLSALPKEIDAATLPRAIQVYLQA